MIRRGLARPRVWTVRRIGRGFPESGSIGLKRARDVRSVSERPAELVRAGPLRNLSRARQLFGTCRDDRR
jgi:hypothetical protein